MPIKKLRPGSTRASKARLPPVNNKQKKENPVLVIERWDDVRARLLRACQIFSHCQHDMKPVTHFLLRLYTIGFHHGAISTADLTAEFHQHIRASRKEIDHPIKTLEEAVQMLLAEMVAVHRPAPLPEHRN